MCEIYIEKERARSETGRYTDRNGEKEMCVFERVCRLDRGLRFRAIIGATWMSKTMISTSAVVAISMLV